MSSVEVPRPSSSLIILALSKLSGELIPPLVPALLTHASHLSACRPHLTCGVADISASSDLACYAETPAIFLAIRQLLQLYRRGIMVDCVRLHHRRPLKE